MFGIVYLSIHNGQRPSKAVAKVQALALHVTVDRLKHGEVMPEFNEYLFYSSMI